MDQHRIRLCLLDRLMSEADSPADLNEDFRESAFAPEIWWPRPEARRVPGGNPRLVKRCVTVAKSSIMLSEGAGVLGDAIRIVRIREGILKPERRPVMHEIDDGLDTMSV